MSTRNNPVFISLIFLSSSEASFSSTILRTELEESLTILPKPNGLSRTIVPIVKSFLLDLCTSINWSRISLSINGVSPGRIMV